MIAIEPYFKYQRDWNDMDTIDQMQHQLSNSSFYQSLMFWTSQKYQVEQMGYTVVESINETDS